MTYEWFIGWAKEVTVWDLVIWGGALLAVGGFVTKKAWPWAVGVATGLVNLSQMVTAVTGLAAFIARTDDTLSDQSNTLDAQDVEIESIRHETHTNNGSSIKDAVNRIEKTLNNTVLPGLTSLTFDIDAFRNAETRTTVAVVTTKESDPHE